MLKTILVKTLSFSFPKTFAKKGVAFFIAPTRRRQKKYWPGSFNDFACQHLICGEYTIPVWTSGNGPAVLLVHGWERDHFAMGGFVRPLLAAGFRVAALDLPAHGYASGDRAPLPNLAQAIKCAAQSLDGPVIIIAHSLGGAMTILADEAYGLSPRAIALISTPQSAKSYALAQAQLLGLSQKAIIEMMKGIEQALGESLERYRVDRALSSLRPALFVAHAHDDVVVPIQEAHINAAAADAETLWLPSGGHNKILANEFLINRVVNWVVHHHRIQQKSLGQW
ncbi:alpha/beta hydrolase [Reinekea sp.]|uniref:alpha/beta hydrolase n=1 Tax=Reinekea sp. TaxID=1970455 RepID=UPI00257A4DA3|nr:alpha/beta hydrolase [Reinekea sp.]